MHLRCVTLSLMQLAELISFILTMPNMRPSREAPTWPLQTKFCPMFNTIQIYFKEADIQPELIIDYQDTSDPLRACRI